MSQYEIEIDNGTPQLQMNKVPHANGFTSDQPPQVPAMPQEPMADKAPPTVQNIQQLGTASIPSPGESNIYCLNIIGQVEGHIILPPQNKTTKYEHIIPQLVAAEQNSKIEGVLVILNTVGGDVEAGLAIAEMISSLSKPTVTLVLGGGHSIGVPIAVASNISIIAETATMTIHPIRLTGLVIGVPQTFEYLDKMQERVVRFVVSHSNITDVAFKELMFKTGELTRDIGTTVIGTDAVRAGLIDEIGGIQTALQHLNRLIEVKRATGTTDSIVNKKGFVENGNIQQNSPEGQQPSTTLYTEQEQSSIPSQSNASGRGNQI